MHELFLQEGRRGPPRLAPCFAPRHFIGVKFCTSLSAPLLQRMIVPIFSFPKFHPCQFATTPIIVIERGTLKCRV